MSPPSRRGAVACTLALALLVAAGCATLDLRTVPREPSSALADPTGTRLHARFAARVAAERGRSGFVTLERGLDAFVARAALADAADRTLDLQYYIVHGDTSSRLLLGRVFAAAERGVRVRLLIDDWTLADADEALAQLDAHPSVEVRVFNPLGTRHWLNPARWAELIGDFERINRRMHNKAWIADGVAAIVGGRNLGDEYFEARNDLDYHDLDLLAVGPVVGETSASFDRYWNSRYAVPVRQFRQVAANPAQREAVRRWFDEDAARSAGTPYARALADSPLVDRLRGDRLALEWGEAKLVADDPAKLDVREGDPALRAPGDPRRALLLTGQLESLGIEARREVLLVAPYFVPGEAGVAAFEALVRRGIRVRILTNSLASNDVIATQAGYARHRDALLRAGVELHEFKPDGGGRGGRARAPSGVAGGSRAALHEKSFVVDREAAFVGSLNLDPRSIRTNTEVGVLVRSAALAAEIAAIFDRNAAPERAWRVERVDGAVVWTDLSGPTPVSHRAEPGASGWRRLLQSVYGLLAPESML
jgi:putative cardiolipin synthase